MTNSALAFSSKIKSEMYNNKYILTYRGEISQQIILALLNMTERKLDSAKEQVTVRSKLFNVIVGCLQNITAQNPQNKYAKSSMFAISQVDDGYNVYSGNALKNDHITELEDKLNKISTMSEADLKELYRLWLKSRELEANDTSIGLIDIARRTGNEIEYDFESIDDDYSFFALRTKVKH